MTITYMNDQLLEELKKVIKGDVATDEETLTTHSMDKSIFAVKPQVVVYPKDDEDVQNLVQFVTKHKKSHPDLHITPRSAGTDMSGGGLNTSIIIDFMKYFNHAPHVYEQAKTARVQPGVYYRDFEKETLKHGLLYPPYPSSREICAMGGILNNNAGGEKSLRYGKAEDYLINSQVVFSDGNEYEVKPLTEGELARKMKQRNFEGEVYRKMHALIMKNFDMLQEAKPKVTKNSAGYYLWNIYNPKKKLFDLNRLLVGAQGTLGIMTEGTVKLVPVKKHAEMLIIYVRDLTHLAEIVNVILPFQPESLETYDDITLKLALKYFPSFAKKLGTHGTLETAWQFLPEFIMKATGQLPRLTIQAEFTSDSRAEINDKIAQIEEKLKDSGAKMKIAPNKNATKKYWLIRRDSFGLLSTRIKTKYASPFIDDIVIPPDVLPEFLPKLQAILHKYPTIQATFAGHVGNGNFHVIPLVNLRDKAEHKHIEKICEEVFKLVIDYKGSTSGEHNDGWIRTPYLPMQYDARILKLFEETKRIFDPHGVFNPHKKTNPDKAFAMSHIRSEW